MLTVVVAPAEEPVSIDEAKSHVRYTGSTEDPLIAGMLQAAREQCELVARRAFVTQTIEMRLQRWPVPAGLSLPRPPLQSVLAVEYTDATGTLHTLPADDYTVYPAPEPGLLVLKPTAIWPAADLMPGPSIVVRYVAGYGLAAAVPARYRQAILLLFGTWFANREHVTFGATPHQLPDAVRALLLADRGYV